ncbi:MAG: acetoin dehydrogenase [Actinobacteria bacterium]|uniref:Unannotated protein n=1 Tax=freshwater metagenome TaxID=449393 RepID=A0A6J7IPJ4_9ZZZZ|nr:acetoin dehydrogenase [Actinomycetota bacterium]
MSAHTDDHEVTYIRAVNHALDDALAADESVILYGEDVGIPNGPYGASKGLRALYGDRVFDTPISESAMIGAALGASMGGLRPVVEVMFADFLLVAMDQVINQIANTRYVSRGQITAPLVIRTQQGSTPGSCAQHSKSLEAMFAHIPGLLVAVPSTPQDAYSILRGAIDSDDPVMVFESRRLYPSKGTLQRDPDPRIGIADVVRPGNDVTVVTWGTCRPLCEQAATTLAGQGVDCEVIDLRWISPWDSTTVIDSVARTGRLVVAHEAVQNAGFGAEVVTTVVEALGPRLLAARRVATLSAPMPASPLLSAQLLPSADSIARAILDTIGEQ